MGSKKSFTAADHVLHPMNTDCARLSFLQCPLSPRHPTRNHVNIFMFESRVLKNKNCTL